MIQGTNHECEKILMTLKQTIVFLDFIILIRFVTQSQERKKITTNHFIQTMVNKYFILFFIFSSIVFVESATDVKVRVSNMTEPMKQDAIRITKQAFDKFNGYSIKSRSTIAQYITFQFNKLHQPTWQCIIGPDYGMSITSENEKRIILDVQKIAIVIFKGKC